MEIRNDKYVGLKMPTVMWSDLKEIAEGMGYCTGSYIRYILYREMEKVAPKRKSATSK